MFTCDARKVFDKFSQPFRKMTMFLLHWLRNIFHVFEDSLMLCWKLGVCFSLWSYSGGFLWLKSSAGKDYPVLCPKCQQRHSCFFPPCTWAFSPLEEELICLVPWGHTNTRCLSGYGVSWFDSNGDDRALHYNYLLLLLLSHLSKQSVASGLLSPWRLISSLRGLTL